MLQHVLPIIAAITVVGCVLAAHRNSRLLRYLITLTLGGAAVLAIGNYIDFGRWPHNSYLNGWEFFHYYLGSKYVKEIGYTGLYEASLLADCETGRKFHYSKDTIRDLSTGGYISVKKALVRAKEWKGRFSADRWSEFQGDIRYFKSILSQFRWDNVLRDKGYNGTPAWGLVAGIFSNHIPTSSYAGMLFLSLLDPILMAIAVVAVWRTFGHHTALLMVILVGTHMAMSHSHMKGAFLRTDWAMSLVLAVCALKSGRPALGGAFVAYAAIARLFPMVFAFGIAAKLLVGWIRYKHPRPEHVRFCVAFVLVCAVLGGMPLLLQGPGLTREFASKIEKHDDSFSGWRVGFKHVFLGAYADRARGTGTFQEVFHNRVIVWRLIQASVLLLCGWLVQRMPDHEALAFGFVPVFFMFAPTYYYYIMLVVPLLYLASRLELPINALGIVWLLLSSNIAYLFYGVVGRQMSLFYALSMLFFVLCIIMVVAAVLRALRLELGFVRSEDVNQTTDLTPTPAPSASIPWAW